MKKKTYCVQFYTSGSLEPEHVWVHCCDDHPGKRCTGRGHDVPGCFRHVWTTSAVQALRLALGWSWRRATEHMKWQEEERRSWTREERP